MIIKKNVVLYFICQRMNKLIISLALLILVSSCKNNTFYSPKKVHGKQTIVLPYTIKRDLLILRSEVASKKGNFIFDTGAKSIVFSSFDSVLQQTNEKLEAINVTDINNNSQQTLIKKYPLTLGNVTLNKHIFCIINKPPFLSVNCSEKDSLHGFIGNDVLNQGVFSFSHKDSILTIYSKIKHVKDIKSYEKIPLIINKSGYMYVQINGEYYLIDTGLSNSFINSNDSTLISNTSSIDTISTIVSGAFSDSVYAFVNQERSIAWGNENFAVRYFYSPSFSNGVGLNWLLKYDVIFDVKEKYMYVKNNNEFFNSTIKNQVIVRFYKGAMKIVKLHGNHRTLHIGDKVLEINGVSTESIKSDCDWVDFKNANNLTNINQICIDKNGEKVYIEL